MGVSNAGKGSIVTGPTPDAVAMQRGRVMEELRGYGATFTEVSRRFAAWLSLHHTDAVALLEIVEAERRGDPLSPARLSERVSLTSGATTALINRLERADHVVRTREHADRRVVTLHATAHVGQLAEEYFAPLGARLDAMMGQYPPELLRQFEGFVRELRDTMEDQLQQQNSSR
jgi:DNA-binding MarR family transcriptional regulator